MERRRPASDRARLPPQLEPSTWEASDITTGPRRPTLTNSYMHGVTPVYSWGNTGWHALIRNISVVIIMMTFVTWLPDSDFRYQCPGEHLFGKLGRFHISYIKRELWANSLFNAVVMSRFNPDYRYPNIYRQTVEVKILLTTRQQRVLPLMVIVQCEISGVERLIGVPFTSRDIFDEL